MHLFEFSLMLTTFLCSLVAGFLFAFAIVVMPGIGTLSDRQFLCAFQAMDRVIQDNQTIFLLVWVGSVVALLGSAVGGVVYLDETGRMLLISATLVYLLGVQLPTFAFNIPLNNKLQVLKLDGMDETALKVMRTSFESRWNQWNRIRTVLSCLTSVLMITLLFQFSRLW
jgi:uncharacterized membrane protein